MAIMKSYLVMRRLITILLIFYFLYVSFGNATEQHVTTITRNDNNGPYAMIKDGQCLLKEGDLVVRLNRDPTSQFIKNFNQHDKAFRIRESYCMIKDALIYIT